MGRVLFFECKPDEAETAADLIFLDDVCTASATSCPLNTLISDKLAGGNRTNSNRVSDRETGSINVGGKTHKKHK
jgi:hypothetical protein